LEFDEKLPAMRMLVGVCAIAEVATAPRQMSAAPARRRMEGKRDGMENLMGWVDK
jgi:hypothetical protein